MNTQFTAEHSHPKQIFLHDPDDLENKLDILEYWRSITKRKVQILAFGAVFALLAAVIVFVMTPIYRSTATIMIESGKGKVLMIEEVVAGASQNREYFQTQIEIIKSREVSLKTVQKMKLWENEEFDPRSKSSSPITDLLVSIGLKSDPTAFEWTEEILANAVLSNFASRVMIEPVRGSQLVKISFESRSPQMAAKAANALAEVYIESDLDARYKVTRQATNWIQDRLLSLREKLEESERGLQGYREKQGIVESKGMGQGGAGKQFEEVTGRLVEARMRRVEAENAYNQIKSATKSGEMSSLASVIRNASVSDAVKQVSDVERRLAELSQRYGAEHPKIQQAEAELKSTRQNLQRQIETMVASSTRELEVARGVERSLEGVLSSARGSVQNINRKEFELGVLEREVESNRQFYDMFVKRAKETNVAGDLQSPVARVIDYAILGGIVKPHKMQIIFIALVAGLFVAVLISLLLDRMDNTLKTTEDVESKLKAPLLTSLPLLSPDEVERHQTARIFIDSPKSIYSEAIRSARTGVLLSAIDIPKRLILVTSSLPGEGKTTFSINLAMAHAHTKKTLLIDADMRRPAITKGLSLPPGARGLSNLVSGTATLDECLQKMEGTELAIMPSGTIPPNPLELLLSDKFKDTLASLSELFDVIIIDSPPVELVSDALVIASLSTGVVYVTKAMSTPYPVVRKGLQRVRRAEGQILGVVLNHLDFEKAAKYYGEYSGYGAYGYGKSGYSGYAAVYGSENSPS